MDKNMDQILKKTLQLSLNTIIQVENNDLIRIGTDPTNLLIYHKDVLLLLPDFFEWCQVESFINSNSEGKEEILDVITKFYNSGILEELNPPKESVISSNQSLVDSVSSTEKIFFNVHNHHLMIKDYVRVSAYQKAIEANISSKDTVLELGCGSGILTLLAARAGAKKLYAIEINRDIVENLAKPMIEANGYKEKVDFLVGNSMKIPASALTPKPNVFISEILGDGIFNENIISYTIDARDRLLAPGAIMIPKGLDVYIFAYEDPKQKDTFLNSDIRFVNKAKSSKTESIYLKYDVFNNKKLSESEKAIHIDLTTIKENKFEANGYLNITSSGKLNGCCLYFTAYVDDNSLLSNSPWNPQISWAQQLLNVNPSINVNIGDKIPFKLFYDGNLELRLD